MIPFDDLVNRWQTYSGVPTYVGSTPEGTLPPYTSINVIQSNPNFLSGNTGSWTESLIQFSAVTETLAQSEQLADTAVLAFHLKTFGSVIDMTLLNRTTAYSDQPSLTGNKAWTAVMEFRVRH
jgi:hypothetical protein